MPNKNKYTPNGAFTFGTFFLYTSGFLLTFKALR